MRSIDPNEVICDLKLKFEHTALFHPCPPSKSTVYDKEHWIWPCFETSDSG